MLNIGMTELLIFGIIALLVLGPDKLPEAVRFVGTWYGKIKRMVSNVQNDLDRELRLSELRGQMQAEMQRIQELEAKMQAQMTDLQQPMATDEVKIKSQAVQPLLSYQPVIQPVSPVYLPKPTAIQTVISEQRYTEMKVAV
ncbi:MULTISPECIES: Sec-independent protein translocase protein TatB [Acinetobacter]|jgi:sec-independent protein translocase protein TatB|uniref:Sec-independent protein translocase protein TatB n=1 Tax=Acinetobacter TaxID=469 RepID=UPI0015D287E2|nr:MULTISPECIES: Sec-independent protein translocase protein TatB [Acinetobacter]MEB6679203.1 Sec-independent protein translocase protein TatB [Acinetobacter lwoffii]